jgi:hypothetical protein
MMLVRTILIVLGVVGIALLNAIAASSLNQPIIDETMNAVIESAHQPRSPIAATGSAGAIKPTQALPIEEQWPNQFTFHTRSITEKHEGYCPYELSAAYPEIVGTKGPELSRFNQWIKRKVLRDVRRFQGLQLRAEPGARKAGKKSVTEGLELTFRVYYSDAELISLVFTHRVMAAGQMHPINYYETINFDLRKSRPLHTRDIFKQGYLRVLSEYSRKHLTETYDIADDDWMRDGTAPSPDNFPNWNIVPDGILVSFEDYQVNSHNFGQPEFVVPYSVLRKVILRKSARWFAGQRAHGSKTHQRS